MPIIYLATSLKTGKSYVGCTTKGLETRKAQHHASAVNGSPYKFHKALREEGFSSFVWKVLEQPSDTTTMYAREKYWIAAYNSYRTGLNSTLGGAGTRADGWRRQGKGPHQPPRKRYRPMLLLRR